MRSIRLHLVGILLTLIGIVTSVPQPPLRHQAELLRNPAFVQLDDDDDRERDAAILEDEDEDGGDERERGRRA